MRFIYFWFSFLLLIPMASGQILSSDYAKQKAASRAEKNQDEREGFKPVKKIFIASIPYSPAQLKESLAPPRYQSVQRKRPTNSRSPTSALPPQANPNMMQENYPKITNLPEKILLPRESEIVFESLPRLFNKQ